MGGSCARAPASPAGRGLAGGFKDESARGGGQGGLAAAAGPVPQACRACALRALRSFADAGQRVQNNSRGSRPCRRCSTRKARPARKQRKARIPSAGSGSGCSPPPSGRKVSEWGQGAWKRAARRRSGPAQIRGPALDDGRGQRYRGLVRLPAQQPLRGLLATPVQPCAGPAGLPPLIESLCCFQSAARFALCFPSVFHPGQDRSR